MDYNKIFSDFRKYGIHLVVTIINAHTINITGINRLDEKIILHISEHIIKEGFENSEKKYNIYDLCLDVGNKIELQEYYIDENEFNKLYERILFQISQTLNQSVIENNNE